MFKRLQRNICTIKNFEQFGMFQNFQFIPKHSNLFSEYFKKCSGTLRHFFKCLPKHSDLFSILFPNIRMFWRTFIFVLWTFKKCSGKLSDYSETFRFIFGTFQKCSGTLRRFQKFYNGNQSVVMETKMFPKQICLGTIQIQKVL